MRFPLWHPKTKKRMSYTLYDCVDSFDRSHWVHCATHYRWAYSYGSSYMDQTFETCISAAIYILTINYLLTLYTFSKRKKIIFNNGLLGPC
jgi:hypothetical protein